MQSNSRTLVVAAFVVALLAGGWWLLSRNGSNPTDVRKPEPPAEALSKYETARAAVSVAPPVSAPGKRTLKTPGVIASAAWGGNKNQIGREVPEEGNPEGPMSFTIAGDGSLVVLDQINGRLARYDKDGSRLADTRIDATYPQDVAIADDGTTAVLDRLKDKNITLLDQDGRVIGTLPLEGEAIGDTGGITGVFMDGDKVYVEREHGTLVEVGSTDGKPAEQPEELPGRPSRDGTLLLTAGITEAPSGRIFVSAINRSTRDHQFTRELRLEDSVLFLVLLDSDKLGTIYVAAVIGEPDPPPGDVRVQLVCLEPSSGAPVGGALMPANTLADETFRDLVVLDDGGVVYAERTETGVTYRIYQCS